MILNTDSFNMMGHKTKTKKFHLICPYDYKATATVMKIHVVLTHIVPRTKIVEFEI